MTNDLKTRKVLLADGYEIELSYSEAFYDKVRKFFDLAPTETPSDEHLKNFLTTFMAAVR